MQKRAVFYVHVIFREQSGQTGVEKGALLTTYLFRYTPECTFRSQIFLIFFASGGKGALTPSNQNPADVPDVNCSVLSKPAHISSVRIAVRNHRGPGTVGIGLPDFPRRNTGDFCPSIHDPSPVHPMCRYIISCMLPSGHKFHTSSEHC